MSGFTRIAVKKINSFLNREDFVSFDVADGAVEITFKYSKCTIDKTGRVEWVDD